MEFWLCVAGIVLLFLSFPYIRCFFKRLVCRSKLKSVCREKGYTFIGNHIAWFLGGRNGKRCDCFVETQKDVFAIKLFGVPRKRRVLVFEEDGGYFTRKFAGVAWRSILYSFDSKAEEFPVYDFGYKYEEESEEKTIRKVLLMNPVPMEMRMQAKNSKETIVSPGDKVYDLVVYNLSGLLKELRG